MKEQSIGALAVGVLAGMLLAPSTVDAVSNALTATRSSQHIYVDGQRVSMAAFSIEGSNYVRLRDIGKALDVSVTYDAATNSACIDSSAPYVEENTPTASGVTTSNYSSPTSGAIPVPQMDGQPFIPKEGDTILCDDGSTYKITNMSHYRQYPGPLPTPTCDWSQFPAIELPRAETRHFINDCGEDYLFIRNLHETRRMQYTLYNAIGENPQTWRDGRIVLRSDGSPMARVQLYIPDGDSYYTFWPWGPERLTRLFHSCPPGLYKLEAWDVYADGIFLRTEYDIDVE